MSLHTARKKVYELTDEELDRELKSAYKLFRDINWRFEYNKRMKYFKETYPDASDSDIKSQYSKEAHHIANLLNAIGNDYIELLEDYIKLKKNGLK